MIKTLNINNKYYDVDVDSLDIPLLWVLRDFVGLTGTKYSCGKALCGACTVHLNGHAIRACTTPLSQALNNKITTIEGLSTDNSHPVQKAWLEEDVPQCGFCQSGQIMSAAALLNTNPSPSDEEITAAMSGNLCRCGSYPQIFNAVKRASQLISQEN